jgi:hypothetical protein
MIKYRNKHKGVRIKLGNAMTESQSLDIDRKKKKPNIPSGG